MKTFLIISFLSLNVLFSQSLPELKLNKERSSRSYSEINQLKKRQTVTKYAGVGYSLVFFMDQYLRDAYPLLDTRSGNFLTNINLFFGISVAKALTAEFEPSLMFVSSSRLITFALHKPVTIGLVDYTYSNTGRLNMIAIPLTINLRFFPFFKNSKSFSRLFFLGTGGGAIWIREEYDNYYSTSPGIVLNNSVLRTESTSQWAPIIRAAIGFTGTGGAFGFGGEVRFNYVPLKQTDEPFATRYGKAFNSIDLCIRAYFGL